MASVVEGDGGWNVCISQVNEVKFQLGGDDVRSSGVVLYLPLQSGGGVPGLRILVCYSLIDIDIEIALTIEVIVGQAVEFVEKKV